MNIVLTGMMGTGKTEIGKLLAKRLGMGYIDTDEVIKKDVGYSISKIFKKNGEPYFRKVETKAVKCVSILDNFVIATGGGVVLKKENMDELEKNGKIVCLTASADIILERTKKTDYRPLLNVKDKLQTINDLLEKRNKYYKRCSLMIDTTKKKASEVVEEIIEFLKEKELE